MLRYCLVPLLCLCCAATIVFATTTSPIPVQKPSTSGETALTVLGDYDLQVVEFSYPQPGTTVALPFTPKVTFRNNGGVDATNATVRLRIKNNNNEVFYDKSVTVPYFPAEATITIPFPPVTSLGSLGEYSLLSDVGSGQDPNFTNDTLLKAVTVVQTTDVADENNTSIHLSPNPAQDLVTLSCPSAQAAHIEIQSLLGEQMLTMYIPSSATMNTLQIPLQQWASGMYLVSMCYGAITYSTTLHVVH